MKLCVLPLVLFVAFLWTPSSASAASPLLSSLTVTQGSGVQIKGGLIDDNDMDRLYKLGFRFVRFSVGWTGIERQKSVYTWSTLDTLIAKVRAHHLKMVIPLLGGNPLYDGEILAPQPNTDHVKTRPHAPHSAESIDAYARFAAQAVLRYGTQDIVWEIWNEPDLARFWPPGPDVQATAVLTEAACRKVRQIAPKATLVGPALGRVPDVRDGVTPAFWDAFLTSGAVRCLDALSVHPYRHGAEEPEAVFVDYATLIKWMAKRQVYLPLISTELGYSGLQVTPEQQAAYLPRARLIDILWGVPLSIAYEWRDSRDDPADLEGHFGLTTITGQDKPVMKVFEALWPRLKDARLERQIATQNPRDLLLLVQHEDGLKGLVGWTLRADPVQLLWEKDGHKEKAFLSRTPRYFAKGYTIDATVQERANDVGN
ncbi:MAG: hypothetical protein AB7E52_05030 [Bdellovibrionales bacterium]